MWAYMQNLRVWARFLKGQVVGELPCDPWASLCHPMPGTSIRQGQQRDAQLSPLTSLPSSSITWNSVSFFLFFFKCLSWLFVFMCSRFGSGCSSCVFDSGRRSQCHLHHLREPKGWASHPRGGLWWQRPSLRHHILRTQVFRGWRVRAQIICLSQCFGGILRSKKF